MNRKQSRQGIASYEVQQWVSPGVCTYPPCQRGPFAHWLQGRARPTKTSNSHFVKDYCSEVVGVACRLVRRLDRAIATLQPGVRRDAPFLCRATQPRRGIDSLASETMLFSFDT